jgi:hypothetical protein
VVLLIVLGVRYLPQHDSQLAVHGEQIREQFMKGNASTCSLVSSRARGDELVINNSVPLFPGTYGILVKTGMGQLVVHPFIDDDIYWKNLEEYIPPDDPAYSTRRERLYNFFAVHGLNAYNC